MSRGNIRLRYKERIMKIKYPTIEDIINCNINILKEIRVKKADQFKILNLQKIVNIINDVRKFKGDIYDKAVFLLRSLIQSHAFASGNRRTGLNVMISFLKLNNININIKKLNDYNVLQGVRESYYSDKEIKEWIKNGKIRKFERF